MLRVLSAEEACLVAGGLTDDPGDGGDDDYDGTDIVVTANMDDNGDTSADFSEDQDGEIVVTAERNMPEGWRDSTWAQIGCKVAMTAADQSDFQSDLVCRVDWSGDNPADPKNANRLSEILKNHADEFANAVKNVQKGVDASIKMGS